MPRSFFGDSLRDPTTDFYLPLSAEPALQGDTSLLHTTNANWLDVIGRVRPGSSVNAIQAQMRVELRQYLRSHWVEMNDTEHTLAPKQTVFLTPGGAGITGMREQYSHWLSVLMVSSGLVLLIVCANMANLMLVRGLEHRGQVSLTLALGARVSRVIRQALTECILLSVLGGIGGLVLAFAGTRAILHMAFTFSFPGAEGPAIPAAPSLPVLLFTFGVALVAGILFGTAPAWMAANADPIEAIRGANRSSQRAGLLPRKMLVMAQAALSLVLLASSGLLIAALHKIVDQNFGFIQDDRTVISFDPSLAGYTTAQLDTVYARIKEELRALPGVDKVAFAGYTPLGGEDWNTIVFIDGRPTPAMNNNIGSALDRVSPGFFAAIGDKIVRGREITEKDTTNAAHVAVINEAFARKFFKDEDPIGKRFGPRPGMTQEFQVVGVVQDARFLSYELDKPVGAFYFPAEAQYTVFPKKDDTDSDARSHFIGEVVVVSRPGTQLNQSAVARAMGRVDKNLPVIRMRTLSEQVDQTFSDQRMIARLSSLFSVLSLLLAAIGMYGITAFNVSRRTMEIGIRVALGARRPHVVGSVFRDMASLLLGGLLLGVPLALSSGQFLNAEL